ncbi:hypothetical protein FPANT_824 [Fusarium pseudoanthophilum]|uniref:Uncharacterized protein n=1 Tax=Fusarium pseudoanthophilum TaxID=48495 RepID=A0A8H5Q210_9HYPO|nr:hypothetical protein FPANT_824 [Fusarium pseudoanthophilum]
MTQAEIFTECFKGSFEGHALYEKVLGNNMKPGTCGYFNHLHKWIPIIHTLDEDIAKDVQRPNARLVDQGQPDKWDVRKSGNVSGARIQVNAAAAVPGAPGGGVAMKYTTHKGQGAVMVPGSKVTAHRAEPAPSFRNWMSKNMQLIASRPMYDEEAVQEKGLWLITGTFTATHRAISVLESAGSEAYIGVDVTIPGAATLGPAVGFWNHREQSSGWIVHTDEKNGVVLYASGIYYKPQLFSKKLKEVERQEKQKWLDADEDSSPIDAELAQGSPGAEYIRFWPYAFGTPYGLDTLPHLDDMEDGDD